MKRRTARQILSALAAAKNYNLIPYYPDAVKADIKAINLCYQKLKGLMGFSEAAMQAEVEYLESVQIVPEKAKKDKEE